MEKRHKQRLSFLLMGTWCVTLSGYIWLSGCDLGAAVLVSWEVVTVSSVYFPLALVVDKVALSFSTLVTFIAFCVFLFSRHYMSEDPHYERFSWILLSFVISMNLLVYAGSFLFLLLGWDGLGITSFALIIYYSSSGSQRAGFLTLLINRLGDVLLMICMIFYANQGHFLVANYAAGAATGLLGFYAMAALTKSAQYPYSAWLPAAMAAPTPVSALVHSSTLVTAGIYIMIRSCMTMNLTAELGSLFLFCGSLTSLVGGACALYENDLKKVIAFSTLSQLGVMVFCLGLGNPHLSLLHLYTHAMFKAMLFLVAGYVLMMAFGVQDLRLLGHVTRRSPILLVFLNTSTLCLVGAPFLSAYYSKHAILGLMLSSSVNLLSVLMMLVATLLTSIYMIRMLKVLNWGRGGASPVTRGDSNLMLFLPCVQLYGGSLVLGWGFSWVDPTYLLSDYLPLPHMLLLHSLLVVGVVAGLLRSQGGISYTIQSMFLMDPVWNSMVRGNPPIFQALGRLEYGWAEPAVYFPYSVRYLHRLAQLNAWPGPSFSFSPAALVLVSIMSLCWYVSY